MSRGVAEILKPRQLFIVTTLLEVGAGLALLVLPSLTVSILIGVPFDTKADSVVGRVAGVALLALGVVAWLARRDEQSRAAKGLIASLFLYNAGAAVVLAYAAVGLGLFGVGLWPAVILHVAMAAWCLANVSPRSGSATT